MIHDPTVLPADLPVQEDDGAAAHLPGTALPPIALPSTDGGNLRLDADRKSDGRSLPRLVAAHQPGLILTGGCR